MKLSSHKAELAEIFDPTGRLVVDVGCGDGAMVRHFAKLGSQAVGIEIDEVQLTRARAAQPVGGERYLIGRGEALPFADGEVDVLLFFNSLHHLPLEVMVPSLAEAARVLKCGGHLVIVEPLAEGLYFEVLKPLEDETEVRAAAAAAISQAPATLQPVAERFYLNTVKFRDCDAFLAHFLAVDPARKERLPPVEAELRRRFAANARAEEGGFAFDQPMRLNHFSRI